MNFLKKFFAAMQGESKTTSSSLIKVNNASSFIKGATSKRPEGGRIRA